MLRFPKVLTIETTAELLQASPEGVYAELEAGRLEGFRLGNEWRVTETALLKFMGVSNSENLQTTESKPVYEAKPHFSSLDFDAILEEVSWQSVAPFDFEWPDGKGPVTYDEVYEGQTKINANSYTLRIAMCTAESLGDKHRRRGVVFMGNPPSLSPLVEFSGENSDAFAKTGRLASIVKLRTGKHLRPGHPIPDEYRGFPLVVYNQLVVGPYAAASLAVVAHKTDLRIMAHHALIRAHWKGLI